MVEPWGPADGLASMTAGALPGYVNPTAYNNMLVPTPERSSFFRRFERRDPCRRRGNGAIGMTAAARPASSENLNSRERRWGVGRFDRNRLLVRLLKSALERMFVFAGRR
jgi:hypothetical protein